MADEKRKIILKEFEPETVEHDDSPESIELRKTAERSFYFGAPVTAKPGEVIEVPEKTAVLAVESGKFKYAPETIEAAAAEVAESKGELPVDFPVHDALAQGNVPITTVEELQNASDDELLAKEGIGPETLKKIRKAESKKK